MLIVGATVIFVIPHVTTQLVGMGRLIEGATGGEVGYAVGVGILLIVMLVYSELGGLRGVVWTDVVQFFLCVGAMAALAILFLHQNWGGSIANLFRDVRSSDNAPLLTTPGPQGFFTLPMLASYCLLFGLWPIGHPTYSVRYLAQSTKRGFLWLVVGMSILPLVMFIPALILGLGGAMKTPGLEKGDQVVGAVLPLVLQAGGAVATVVGFLFVLGALSAAMSTCDSQILATGQIVSRDVVRGLAPNISARGEMRSARIVMFVVLFIAYMIGMADPPLIWKLSILSGVGTTILAPTYLGMLGKNPSLHAALASIACGYVAMVVSETVLTPAYFFGFHNGLFSIAISAAVYGTVSGVRRERP
jgi:SSS family solute:Na+ symporter